MQFKTFIDDSADERQELVVIAGALVGRPAQWRALKGDWRTRLQQESIQYFRSAEYNSLTGQFFKYRDSVRYPKPSGSAAALALRDDLEAIITRLKIGGVAVCIQMPLFRAFKDRSAASAQIFTDPFELALQILFKQLSQAIKADVGDGHKLAFVVDQSQSAQRMERVYLQFKRINSGLAVDMEGLTHLDDKLTPQLQAADMMASVAKEAFIAWPGGSAQSIPKRLEGCVRSVWVPDHEYFEGLLAHEMKRRDLSE